MGWREVALLLSSISERGSTDVWFADEGVREGKDMGPARLGRRIFRMRWRVLSGASGGRSSGSDGLSLRRARRMNLFMMG